MAGNVAKINPYGSSASREHPKHFERPKSLIIDIHGHIRTEGVDEEVRKFVPAMSLDSIKYASPLTRELNKKQGADRNEELVGTSQRLKDMDKMCVDVMAISAMDAPHELHVDRVNALGFPHFLQAPGTFECILPSSDLQNLGSKLQNYTWFSRLFLGSPRFGCDS